MTSHSRTTYFCKKKGMKKKTHADHIGMVEYLLMGADFSLCKVIIQISGN